jgi:hypothetical protein
MQPVSLAKIRFPPARAAIPAWLQAGGRMLAQHCFPAAKAHPAPTCLAMLTQHCFPAAKAHPAPACPTILAQPQAEERMLA